MTTCEQLDDYLCGWLEPDAAHEFAAHLADCETCRSALELQQRIDRNLDAYRESIAIPDSVALPLDAQRNRLSAPAMIAVLAAAVVLLGVGLYLTGHFEDEPVNANVPISNETGDSPAVVVELEQPDEEGTRATLPVSIQAGPGTIAVQVPSDSNRVSVFRVYNVIGDPVDQSTQN